MNLNNNIFINLYKYKRKIADKVLAVAQQQQRKLATKCGKQKENNLRVLFFGTDNFSLPSLKALHKTSNITKLGAVTSFKSPANCVRLYAEKEKLPLQRWPIEVDACCDYDLGVVVSFGHLIPERLIRAFPYGMINVHASLLPRWRGAAPIIYAIMHGDAKTGVSIMKIEPKRFDIGDILAQQEVHIKQNILMPELHAELAKQGANLLVNVLQDFPLSFHNAKKQNDAEATFAPKITAEVTDICWSTLTAQQVYDRHRALFSFKHLNTKFQLKNIQLLDVRLPTSSPTADKARSTLGQAGAFSYQREQKCLLVRCAEHTYLELHQLRVEGKKPMNAMDFNNGFLKKNKAQELVFSNEECKSHFKASINMN